MPRFYLHIRDGVRIDDDDGMEFSTVEEARQEALRAAREMVADAVKRGEEIPANDRIIIADAYGNSVMAVPFRDAVRFP